MCENTFTWTVNILYIYRNPVNRYKWAENSRFFGCAFPQNRLFHPKTIYHVCTDRKVHVSIIIMHHINLPCAEILMRAHAHIRTSNSARCPFIPTHFLVCHVRRFFSFVLGLPDRQFAEKRINFKLMCSQILHRQNECQQKFTAFYSHRYGNDTAVVVVVVVVVGCCLDEMSVCVRACVWDLIYTIHTFTTEWIVAEWQTENCFKTCLLIVSSLNCNPRHC